jgi:hypothetical protein
MGIFRCLANKWPTKPDNVETVRHWIEDMTQSNLVIGECEIMHTPRSVPGMGSNLRPTAPPTNSLDSVALCLQGPEFNGDVTRSTYGFRKREKKKNQKKKPPSSNVFKKSPPCPSTPPP